MPTRSAHSYCRGHMDACSSLSTRSVTFSYVEDVEHEPGNPTQATTSGEGERQFTVTNARYLKHVIIS